MVERFPESLQGAYRANKIRLTLSSLVMSVIFVFLLKSYKWGMDCSNFHHLFIFYFFFVFFLIFIYKFHRLIKLTVVIGDSSVKYSFDRETWISFEIHEVEKIIYESWNIEVVLKNRNIDLPPFGDGMEMKVIDFFRKNGIECIEHSSD